MKLVRFVIVVVLAGAGVRLARSRHRRSLHPDGRSFTGVLEVWGLSEATGSALIDRPGRHPVTVRLSKGAGTRPGRADVLGLAVRVPGPDRPADLLLSTVGTGPLTRHLPVPRRDFATSYGTITGYRTGSGRKLHLMAGPDPDAPAPGRTLESIRAGAALLLSAGGPDAFGRVTIGDRLPEQADAALAFDPVRNSWADLHPTGSVHGIRAAAYRLSQRWRGVRPPAPNPGAVARTARHR